MNKTAMNVACATLVTGNYESPKAEVVEILSEGVLCQSGQFEEWEEETLNW